MKPAVTLKEVLKPPFTLSQGRIEDRNENLICVCGVGHGQYLNGKLSEFLFAALNEKWEHDFGDGEK